MERLLPSFSPETQGQASDAAGLAGEGFHLDNIGAPVGQHLAGSRAGACHGEINHADAFQRSMCCHIELPPEMKYKM